MIERGHMVEEIMLNSNHRSSVRRRRNQNPSGGANGRLNDSILSGFQSINDNMRNLLNQLSPSGGPVIETIHISTNQQHPPFHAISPSVNNIGIIQNRARGDHHNEFELDRRFTELQSFIRDRLPTLENPPGQRRFGRRTSQNQSRINQENDNLSESNSFEMNWMDNPNNGGTSRNRIRLDSARQRQMRLFRVDQTSQRRLNPLDDNRVESNAAQLGNQLLEQSNMFQEDLQESDSDSGMLMGDEDHFDILDHDDYSSGTDNNEDPIGVNMEGMRLPQEEDDEVINAMEINNGFQESSFGNLFDLGGGLPPNNNPNLMTQPIGANPDGLPNLVFDNNQQPIEIRNIRELETVLSGNANLGPEEPIRTGHELMNVMNQPHPPEQLNLNRSFDRYSNSSHSPMPNFHENVSDDFEESNPEPQLAEENPNPNPNQDSSDSEVWEDYCSCDEDDHGPPSQLDVDHILRKGRSQSGEQSVSELNRTSSMHQLNSSKLSIESGLQREGDSPENRSFSKNKNGLRNLPFLTKLLFSMTQPFLTNEQNLRNPSKDKNKRKHKKKVYKDLLQFRIHADIWGERYFDLLGHSCEPKYAKYPFRFPRKLHFQMAKVQMDFGSNVIASRLCHTDYSLKTPNWTNLPVVYRPFRPKNRQLQSDKHSQTAPAMFDSPKATECKQIVSEHEDSGDMTRPSILFADIRLIVLGLKKENLFWKKNFEEFNSVDLSEWDLGSLRKTVMLDDLAKTLLSRSKDLYNYPRPNRMLKSSVLSNFEFHKSLYWGNNMNKQSVLEKLSILRHNMFSVSSFDFIHFASETIRNSTPLHRRSMLTLCQDLEDSSDDSSENSCNLMAQTNDLSIFQILKFKHKMKDTKPTKIIQEKDIAYDQLRKICDFQREVEIESDYFNKILLSQLDKLDKKLSKGVLVKKLENKKKKLVKFAQKHVGYFDLSLLDLEGKHAFLVTPKKPQRHSAPKKDQSKPISRSVKLNKEFTISGNEVGNTRTSILNSGFFSETYGRRNIFQPIRDRLNPETLANNVTSQVERDGNPPTREPQLTIQPSHNFLQRINVQPPTTGENNPTGPPEEVQNPAQNDQNNQNQEAQSNTQAPLQFHFEFNFNLPNAGAQNQETQNNGETSNPNVQENQGPNHVVDLGEPIEVDTQERLENERSRGNEDGGPEPNNPETENGNGEANEGNVGEEENREEANAEENGEANTNEVQNIVRQVEQENAEVERHVFNFREMGLPENFLEMAGIPEEVFNTYTPDIQTEIINIYATDMNLFEFPVELAPVPQDGRQLPGMTANPVPTNTNQHPTPNPELVGAPVNQNQNQANDNQPPTVPNEQANPNNEPGNTQPNGNNENAGTGNGREAQTTPVEPAQPNDGVVRAQWITPTQTQNRHFLFELDATLRQNILAEMPQEEIDLLPLELRNQANRVRIERGIFPPHPPFTRDNGDIVISRDQQRTFARISNRFGLGNVRVRVENGAQTNNREEQGQMEMQYSGVDRVQNCINEAKMFLEKMKKHNKEKNFYEGLHKQKKLLVLRPSNEKILGVWMKALGFLNMNSSLRVAFPYLMNREKETIYNQKALEQLKSFLDHLAKKSIGKGQDKRILISPRDATYLKNLLGFMAEAIKTHNSFYVNNPGNLHFLFELLRVVVLIEDEVTHSRFLLLIIAVMRYLLKGTGQGICSGRPRLNFKINIFEMRTLTLLLLNPRRFSNKREILMNVFYLVDLLMQNPENLSELTEGLADFVNRFCEKINVRFGEIKKLTFEKKVRVCVNVENKKKKKVRLTTKTLSAEGAKQVEQKVEGLKTQIEFLLRIFQKLELVFIKLVNNCNRTEHLMRFLENELVSHSIDFLQKKEAGTDKDKFVKFKPLVHMFQKKFCDEEIQHVYLSFAKMLRKKNLKAMFKNMFLIFRVFEENFQQLVLDRQRLSQPLFYRLEPILETFLVFYKMILNADIQDFFKRTLSQKVVKLKRQMKKLYRTYQTRVTKVSGKQAIQELIGKLQDSGDSFGKNVSFLDDQNSSADGSADLGLFQHKKVEIKTSEYRPRFNQPERSRRSGVELQPRSSQKIELRNRSRDESNVTENSVDRQDLSYLMAKNESAQNVSESRVIKTQTLNNIRSEFNKLFHSGVKMNKKVVNHFIQSKAKIWTSAFYVIVKRLPGFITFENKRKFFRQFIQNISERKVERISVNRLNLFQTAFSELSNRPKEFFTSKWNITFSGEEGEDAGGVSREFFLKLSRAFLNPNYNYFRPASHGYAFHPSPTSSMGGVDPGVFKFIGRIVGKALFDGCYLDAHFTRAFYKQMIGCKLDYGDFEDYDPEYFKNLKWVIDNDPAPLSLTFTVEQNEFGVTREIELKPGGATIEVTQANKNEYIDLLVKHKLSDQAKTQVQEFLQGLYDVVPLNLLRIFDPKEIELMISGLPEININDLEKHTEYMGYSKDSVIIRWFWKTLRSYDTNLKAGFLQFVTGTSKVPLEGFEFLKGMGGNVQRFQIHKSFTPQNLPTSHTCMNQLDLPEYSSEEELREKLTKAIEFGKEGFGFV